MCLGIPGQVVDILPGNAGLLATVDVLGAQRPINLGMLEDPVVAPGEWITSAATGRIRTHAGLDAVTAEGRADPDLTYAPDSGTSMAAPHVSGVIAAFLSVRGEFTGRPELVKQVFVAAATDLKRRPEFQGAGLLDLMRALQAV